MGASFREQAWPAGIAVAGATALAASLLFLGAGGIAAFVIAGACALAVGGLCMWLVGGMTGDVIGATIEITEAVVILCIAFAANRGWIEAWVLA
jgi:cobalamin synthase